MAIEIWTVHDSEGKKYYKGSNSREALEVIRSNGGITILRSYHGVGDSVAINETTYDGDKETSHTLRYVSGSEIEIMLQVLRS